MPVTLLVSHGTLSLATTTGLNFTGASSGASIQFEGTLTNVNRALETVYYTRGSIGTDTLEIRLIEPGEVFFEENGHLYEYVASANINWNDANTAASGRTKYGAAGYLTTITSENENEFVAARLIGAGWMGASDAAAEGAWRWVTGPEAGTQFWQGGIDGTAVDGAYENWNENEPNNSTGNEDCAQFLDNGLWNDLNCTTSLLPGYVVEYGTPEQMPSVASRDISITTINPPTVESLSPADNATTTATTDNLMMTFDTPVTPAIGTIHIRLSSDDSVVESIDVTSEQVSGANTTTITIDPSAALDDETSYYILVSSTAFVAYSSTTIYFAGIADATNVAINPLFTMTFDEPVDLETGNIVIYRSTDKTAAQTISVTSSAVTKATSSTVSFTLQNTLSYSTSYYIKIDATAVDDTSSNSFAGISTSTTWSFTTIEAPQTARGGSSAVVITPPQSRDFSGTAISQGENGLTPRFAKDTLESNADETVVTGMALSLDDPTFTGISIISYSSVYDIDVPQDGQDHILYVRYFSTTGHRSQDFEILIPATAEEPGVEEPSELQEPLTTPTTSPATGVEAPFTTPLALSRSLERGMTGKDVRLLQQILNYLGFSISESGPGSRGNETNFFGQLTYDAVLRFQTAYSEQILTPLGLNAPTGSVGPSTIAVLRLRTNQ